jgi:hypothetical protein
MRNAFRLLPLLICLLPLPALGSPDAHPPTVMPKEFDVMKQLVGTWEGTAKMGEKEEPVTVIYKMTAAGTALTETLMPGTPHEMVSVYHKDGRSLAMTHYCATGNQPHMKLKKGDAQSISFEMTKPTGISSAKEAHMHAVTLTLADPDTLKQEWTFYTDGKKSGVNAFNFKRKKG